MIEININK